MFPYSFMMYNWEKSWRDKLGDITQKVYFVSGIFHSIHGAYGMGFLQGG